MKWVVNALTNSTFSPVSGCVRTTGCSASGNRSCSARRCSSGMLAPKLASMLCRARRSVDLRLDVLGQAAVGLDHVHPDGVAADGGLSTQRSTEPIGGASRQVASQW